MITHVDLLKFRHANISRNALWLTGGICGWSASRWACALAGELGELVEAFVMLRGARSDCALINFGKECADVFIYLDCLSERLGLSFIGGKHGIDAPEMTSSMALEQVQISVGRLCDVVKKLNRHADGVPGNTHSPAELKRMACALVDGAALGLASIANSVGLDLWEEVISKFDEVSRRNEFDVYLSADGVAA